MLAILPTFWSNALTFFRAKMPFSPLRSANSANCLKLVPLRTTLFSCLNQLRSLHFKIKVCCLSVLSSSSSSAIPSRSLITIQHCDNPPTPPPGDLSASKFSSSNPAFVGDTSHALTMRPSSRLRRGTSLQRIQSGVPAGNRQTSSEDISVTADSIEHVYKDVVNRVRCVVGDMYT